MKTKLLSMAFAMLTVCTTQSQDTIAPKWNLEFKNWNFSSDTLDTRPIPFPFWMVRKIALDLEEKQQLELEAQLFALEVEQYQSLLQSLEKKDQTRTLQLQLLEKNLVLLQEQLRVEKQSNKVPARYHWWLRLLGALGAGFLLGRL